MDWRKRGDRSTDLDLTDLIFGEHFHHSMAALTKTNPLAKLRVRDEFSADVLAGITGAVAGAPQAMAFAIIAGISPVYGLYTAFVAAIVGSVFASSKYLTIAPTNALSLIVGTTLLRFEEGNPIERVFVLTLLVGIFQIAFAVLKLGSMTRFVSNAVMTGFITGAGVLIILGQLRELTGYESHIQGGLMLRTWDWLKNLSHVDSHTTMVGIFSILMIYTLHHTRLKSVATLLTIIVTGTWISFFDWGSVALVADMSAIPHQLPAAHLPNWRYIPEMWSIGLAMAVLALVQSAGISQSTTKTHEKQPNITRDFMAQGIANVVGSLFQNMPAGGSISRTAVNISAGARTRMANIFAAIFVGLLLLAVGDFIERIPLATLAGHLIVASGSLIKFKSLEEIWEIGKSAKAALMTTFFSTLVLPLEYSIYIGVGISLVAYIYTSSRNITVIQLEPTDDYHFRQKPLPAKLSSRKPTIIGVYGNLYFAAVSTLENSLPDPADSEIPVVILRLRGNQYLGSTGINLLERYASQLEARGGKLMLCGVEPRVEGQLRRTGKLDRFGPENVLPATEIIMGSTESALQRAQYWIHQQEEALKNVEV